MLTYSRHKTLQICHATVKSKFPVEWLTLLFRICVASINEAISTGLTEWLYRTAQVKPVPTEGLLLHLSPWAVARWFTPFLNSLLYFWQYSGRGIGPSQGLYAGRKNRETYGCNLSGNRTHDYKGSLKIRDNSWFIIGTLWQILFTMWRIFNIHDFSELDSIPICRWLLFCSFYYYRSIPVIDSNDTKKMCQYNDNQSQGERSKVDSRNVVCIKYTWNNAQSSA
jgi:hypothetical protein